MCKNCVADPEGSRAAAEIERETYWTTRSVREWDRFANSFDDDCWASTAKAFHDYLLVAIGPQNASLQFRRQSGWLKHLVEAASAAGEITESILLKAFDAATSRKAEHLLRFFSSQNISVPPRASFRAKTERERVQTAILEIADASQQSLMRRYVLSLTDKASINPTTARLYVRAACNFVVAGRGVFTTRSVHRHLQQYPGDAASLARFISFLRTEQFDLAMPSKRGRKRASGKTSDQFRRCLTWFGTATAFEDTRAACVGVLLGLTGTPLEHLCLLDRAAFSDTDGKALIVLGDDAMEMTHPVIDLFRQYVSCRDEKTGTRQGPLFPGRPMTSPISSASIHLRLAKKNISVKALGMEARRIIKFEAATRREEIARR